MKIFICLNDGTVIIRPVNELVSVQHVNNGIQLNYKNDMFEFYAADEISTMLILK